MKLKRKLRVSLTRGGCYRKLSLRFRCWQHVQLLSLVYNDRSEQLLMLLVAMDGAKNKVDMTIIRN